MADGKSCHLKDFKGRGPCGMKYLIRHESNHRVRVDLLQGRLTDSQADVLQYALSHIKGVTNVEIFKATGNVALTYRGDRQPVLDKLGSLDFSNVTMFAKDLDNRINTAELRERRLDPELKARLRARILLETAADIFLPMPLQVGYHVYQLITLKGL